MRQIRNCLTQYSSPYWCSVPNIKKLACVVPEKNVTEIILWHRRRRIVIPICRLCVTQATQKYLCSRIVVLLMRIKYEPWWRAMYRFFSGKRCMIFFPYKTRISSIPKNRNWLILLVRKNSHCSLASLTCVMNTNYKQFYIKWLRWEL